MLEVIQNYLLFGVVENLVIFMFLRNVCRVSQVKYRDLIPLSLLFVLFGSITIPFVKQILGLITLFAYLKIVSKESFVSCLKKSTMSFMYLLTIETLCCVLVSCLFSVDITTLDRYETFLYFIPIRVLELFIIFLYNKKIKR